MPPRPIKSQRLIIQKRLTRRRFARASYHKGPSSSTSSSSTSSPHAIIMEGVSTAPEVPRVVSENGPVVGVGRTPGYKYPTPSLDYLADTKQSVIYKSVGMDRGRKNLLINSLHPPPPGVDGNAKLIDGEVVRVVHRKVLSQNASWREIEDGLKEKAVVTLLEEEEKGEEELVSWLRGFEGNWILHYMFRRRHTTYLDGLRRLEKKKRIRG
ncbi:hypothetical protein Q9L58_009992 [Maublancomyces gigas]|uniref:Uncharacterized protein n=1 Tax=Discina gigas TaxID=1032678 RepID=A0ABR3G5D1_9PEZI